MYKFVNRIKKETLLERMFCFMYKKTIILFPQFVLFFHKFFGDDTMSRMVLGYILFLWKYNILWKCNLD